MTIVQIAIDVPLDTIFDYIADDVNSDDIGRRVLLPFGRRTVVGVIVGAANQAADPKYKLKMVREVLRDVPPLPAHILELAQFCSAYYHYPLGQVLLGLLPQRLRRTQALGPLTQVCYTITQAGRAIAVTDLPQRAMAKRKMLAALQTQPTLTRRQLLQISASAGSVIREFMDSGWVRESAMPLTATPNAAVLLPAQAAAHALNVDQQTAVEAILGASPGFAPWLLHGVTGSGKTEVYLRAIAAVLARGGQTLVLVPEINLTPQLEARFQARFPQAAIVSLHSNLSEVERLKHWLMAQAGNAHIVLGTRLAVFTPLPQLQLIVVDEEHDSSFKQQDGMRYSARDVAVFRAREARIPVILGSATPALETYHNALQGRYKLLELKARAVRDAVPPTVRYIDLKREKLMEGFSAPLITAIKQGMKRGEQSLLFINRRGFAPVLMCGECGWLSGCPRCTSRLVVHLKEQRLRCHHCGHEERMPHHCPSCGNVDLAPVGQGTQRLEAALTRLFPEARILRVDRDSTRRKNALAEMLQKVHAEEIDILVGTQMLAKGHDFPKLTLVGVLNADGGLYSADFRAAEHLFAQLLQVGGRAGRAAIKGEVLVQTAFPQHPLFTALQHGDYAQFAHTALAERKQAGLPPYTFQAMLRAEAATLEGALKFLRAAAALAPVATQVQVYDPVPALMARLAGKERAQLLIESRSRGALQKFLSAWIIALQVHKTRNVRWALDVDPMDT